MAWYEKFFDGLYSRVLPDVFNEDQTNEQIRVVKKLLRLRKGMRVLDIPCGTGRLTIPMAKTGLQMTGVDLTAGYLRKARQTARKKRLDIHFVRCDMREVDFQNEFHAAFNWFGSFGYFSDADNLAFAKRIFLALKPGGRFLIEGINKSWLLAHFRQHLEQTIAGIRIVHRNKWDPKTGRVLSSWTFHSHSESERRRISMRIYNGSEMRSLLQSAGFRDIKLYGAPPLSQFTRQLELFLVNLPLQVFGRFHKGCVLLIQFFNFLF